MAFEAKITDRDGKKYIHLLSNRSQFSPDYDTDEIRQFFGWEELTDEQLTDAYLEQFLQTTGQMNNGD